MRSVLVNRIRMQGMIVFDWKDRYGEAVSGTGRPRRRRQAQVSRIDRRRARQRARALIGLLKGENFGKQLVRIA